MERKLEATEMWFHRRMLHIYWKDHVTNEERKNREEIDELNQSGANEFPGTYLEKA